MVNSNTRTLGIIFPNSYDYFVPELVGLRLMASIPFASRYRLIDFTLSSMVTSWRTGKYSGFSEKTETEIRPSGKCKYRVQL